MLHSTYSHKYTYEDSKTFSISENLMLLPDNVFWHMLKSSYYYNERMLADSGKLLSCEFWSHLDNVGTDNNAYVGCDGTVPARVLCPGL